MEFLRNLFKPKTSSKPAAGCIFTDGYVVLAGYQPKGPYISGIGGTCLEGEESIKTAMRETIEELLNFTPHDTVLKSLVKLQYSKKLLNGNYTIFVYSFKDLEHILDILHKFKYKSPIYDSFPESIEELIFDRQLANIEVTHLCILPLKADLKIDKNFITDFSLLVEKN